MKTILATLLLCLSAFGQQIDLTKNVKSILPRKNGGLGVGAINSYGGTVASASSITVSCNQSLTVTGATTIQTITMSPSVGCAAILIAGSGATWSTGTSGNISSVITPAVGAAAILVSDGTKFNPGLGGAAGTNGHSILSGSGAPSSGTGVDGDFYLDTATFTLYGPKTAGAWGSGTSLIGPAGPSGVTVTLGPLQFLQGKPDQLTPTQQAADLPYYLTSDYDFPAQIPGGTLTGGSPATATLAPCPLGVSGTDANHYYWLAAGTGTAEAVLGTGGTCTPNAASGTIVFTPANNHGGAWTFASASSGAREAILGSGGNARIKLPSSATLLIAGTNGLVIDKQNLTIEGSGYGSVIQARANQNFNSVIRVTGGDGLRLLNFTVDGNRSNAGTNPTFGAGIDCGVETVGGCNHILIRDMQIYHSAGSGIVIHDTNTDITVENNWIHDNGGVTDGTGSGVGMFVYWANAATQTPASAVRVHHNYFSENHNTITNAGPSSAFAAQGKDIVFTDNYVLNNYNDGGQVVISHCESQRAVISGNIISRTSTGLSEHTSGIETDSSYTTIIGNQINGHTNGTAIALEGNAGCSSGIGSESTTITGNVINGPGGSISLNNAGGFTRATMITANRLAGVASMFIDTATSGTIISDNNFMDSSAPYITDNSVDGAYLSNNFPMAANFAYKGTVASAGSVNLRCGQSATVTGSATISFIVLPAETAATLGAGCMVSLIPSAGATWQLAAGGNISAAVTAVTTGRPILLVSDGTNFNPLTSGASLPSATPLQYLRANAISSAIEGATFPLLIAADYNFPAQQPGGSVAIGSNTKTLAPCPLGLGGSDVNHYIYLSAGSGTAEAVLISGGSCTSGATSGTVVFTAVNTHSGAYTISSASGGIFEAMNTLPVTGGKVRLPRGTVNIYGTLIVGRATATTQSTINAVELIGEGSGRAVDISIPTAGGTTLKWGGAANGTVLKVLGPIGNVRLQDFMIDGNAGAADYGLDIVHSYLSTYENLSITGWNVTGLRSVAVDFAFPLMVAGNNSNRFDTVEVTGGAAGASMVACVFGQAVRDVNSSFDFASNMITNTACLGGAGIGGQIRFADNNTFMMSTFNGSVAALKFMEIAGTGGFPTSNMFFQCPILNLLTSTAAFASTTPNFFYPLTTGEFSQNLTTIAPFASGVDSFGIYFGLHKEAANRVFAGPATGANAAPTFRALVGADLPPLTGTGTVTSVAETMDDVVFNAVVPGSPIVGAGTLAPTLHTQTANTFLAGPTSGGAVAPTFRAIVAGDIPSSLHAVTFVLNGGGSVIATGDTGLYPGSGANTGTINRVDISGGGTAGAACSLTLDIWKRNAAIPTSSQKISASAPATLSSANLAQSGSLSGWTTSVASGDVWGASVASVTGCITALVQVWYQ